MSKYIAPAVIEQREFVFETKQSGKKGKGGGPGHGGGHGGGNKRGGKRGGPFA